MVDRAAAPGVLLSSLDETITRIRAVARRLSPDQLHGPPADGGWSPNEILWHIRAAADVYGEHIKRMLEEDSPRWRHVSPRARMKTSRYDQMVFADSFASFARERAELLARLGNIASGDWRRVAIIRVDKEREWRLTLHERVWAMTNHEEIHCLQMEKLASTGEKS